MCLAMMPSDTDPDLGTLTGPDADAIHGPMSQPGLSPNPFPASLLMPRVGLPMVPPGYPAPV